MPLLHQFAKYSSVVFLALCFVSILGCQNQKEDANSESKNEQEKNDDHPITIVVLDSTPEQLAALDQAVNKEFGFLELGKVTFKFANAKDFLSKPVEGDLVFYPPSMFGSLIKNDLIRKVPDYVVNAESFAQNDLLKQQRRIFCVHDDTRYAISMGISSFFLMARVDILEANGLQVPKTWSEYSDTCERLASLQKEGKLKGMAKTSNWSPSLEPMKGNWLTTTWIARSASYVRTRGRYSVLFDYTNWNPLITTPPFERALEELQSVAKLMSPSHKELDPEGVEQAFLNGESVMAIGWPHPTSNDNDETESEQLVGARLFAIPGALKKFDPSSNSWSDADPEEQSVPMLGVGGWCGSVLSSSKQSGVATRRLGLLAGKEFSTRLASSNQKVFPFRASHLSQIDQWVSPQYGESFCNDLANELDRQNQELIWMTRLRIDRSTDYENTFAEEARKFLGGQPVKEALRNVEEKWKAINKDVDSKLQQTISLEGLGIR